jgi:hypothetical protein
MTSEDSGHMYGRAVFMETRQRVVSDLDKEKDGIRDEDT